MRPRRAVEPLDDAADGESGSSGERSVHGYAPALRGEERDSHERARSTSSRSTRDAKPATRSRSSSTTAAARVRRPRRSPSSNAMVNRLAHGLLASGAQRGRTARVVRPELARGARHDSRGAQAQPRRGAALVPVQRGGDGVRHRQLRRDRGRRRRRASAARRRVRGELPKVQPVRRVRRRRTRRVATTGTTCSPASPTPSPPSSLGAKPARR